MFPALQRVFESAECKTQAQLADFLEIRQSNISDAKKRKSIPAEWLIKLLKLKWINPEWILTGEGSQYLKPSKYQPPEHPHVAYLIEHRPPEECSSQELFSELVKRALSSPDLEEVKRQVAATWFSVAQPKNGTTS